MTEQVPFWWVVVALFVPPVLSLLAVVVAQGWQDRREHSKWLREQRLLAYGECLSLVSDYNDAIVSKAWWESDTWSATFPAIYKARNRLDLVGSDTAREAFYGVYKAIRALDAAKVRLKDEKGRLSLEDFKGGALDEPVGDFVDARTAMAVDVRHEIQGKPSLWTRIRNRGEISRF